MLTYNCHFDCVFRLGWNLNVQLHASIVIANVTHFFFVHAHRIVASFPLEVEHIVGALGAASVAEVGVGSCASLVCLAVLITRPTDPVRAQVLELETLGNTERSIASMRTRSAVSGTLADEYINTCSLSRFGHILCTNSFTRVISIFKLQVTH